MESPNMVWLQLDVQHNELPLRMADSAEELAMLCGVKKDTVLQEASRVKHGKRGRFCKVWIGEDVE